MRLYLLLFIILLASNALAITSVEKGSEWLANNSNWDADIEAVSFSILSLDLTNHGREAELGLERLIDRQDSSGCWPKGNCNVKDTALGLLAIDNFNKNINNAKKYLDDSLKPAPISGTYWIQVVADANGDCKVVYDDKQKIFSLENNEIPQCGNQPWLDVNCIENNFLKDKLSREVTVDCSSLSSNVIISLIYQQSSSYYLIEEEHTNLAKLTINNACYGETKNSNTCDFDSTAFASYALSSIGIAPKTLTYLQSNVQSNDVLGYSLLSLITKKQVYNDFLASQQKPSGNLGNIYTTAYANLALKDTSAGENSTSWLEFQQQPDGSWNNNMKDTAITLYSFVASTTVSREPTCLSSGYSCCLACSDNADRFTSFDDSCNENEICCSSCQEVIEDTCSNLGGEKCNFDESCLGGQLQETSDTQYCCVGGSCIQESSTTTFEDEEECNFDGICDPSEDEFSCPEDCLEEESKFPWVLTISIIIVIIILVLLLFYMKRKGIFFRRRKKKEFKTPFTFPEERPVYQPPRQQTTQIRRPVKKEKIDEELEESLKEAKKLLDESKKK